MLNPTTVLVESTDCGGADDDERGTFQKCGENK